MRELLTIMRGNIRKGKKSYLSLAILMFIASLALSTVITGLNSSKQRDEELMEQCGIGDFMSVTSVKSEEDKAFVCNELVESIRACDDIVEKVEVIPILNINEYELNGDSSNNTQIAMDYASQYIHYNIYNGDGNLLENPVINPGEVVVPACYQSTYDCKIGDVMTVGSEQTSYKLKIVGFFEDPLMGAFVMGVKTILMNGSDMAMIQNDIKACIAAKQPGISDYILDGYFLNIFKNKQCGLNNTLFEQELNKRTGITGYSWISISQTQAKYYMLLFTNIFSGIMAAFAVLLVIITIIVLNHNISSTIEIGYTNIGVLKALGVKNKVIRQSILTGFVGACMLGTLLGIPASIPATGFLNKSLITVTGLYVKSKISLLSVSIVLFAILVIIACFALVKLFGISSITPIKALSNRESDNHFSSLFKLPLSKKLLNVSIAYRQFVSGKRQYIGTIIITGLLSFFLISGGYMNSWASDISLMNDIFSNTDAHIDCSYASEDIKREVEEKLKEFSDYESWAMWNRYFMLNEAQVYCYVSNDPSHYTTVFKGRTCLYENEIIITDFISKEFGVSIGDTVTLSLKGKSDEYIITGLYQSANDVGRNISINSTGYERLTGNDMYELGMKYKFSDVDRVTEICDWINENYTSDDVSVNNNLNTDDFETYKVAIAAVTVLIYILTGLFVGVTIILICDKVFTKEKRDYGIYKAIGFDHRKLRGQFILRFVIVSLIGSLLGIILFAVFSNKFFGIIFRSFGISNFKTGFDFTSVMVSVLFTAFFYSVFAFIASGKIKKIHPRILISE